MGRVKTVVIIGAGLSGLKAAAVLLESRKINVILLEARGRIGGRTHTSSSHSWKTPLDLGCAWIHGTSGNPLWPIAQETDASTFEIASTAIMERNTWLSKKDAEFVIDYVYDLGRKAVQYSKLHQQEIDPSESLQGFCETAVAADIDLKPVMRERITKMIHFFTNVTAEEIDKQSLRNYLLEEELPGDSPLLASTYAPLVQAIAKPAVDAGIIRLRAKVTEIRGSSNGVNVDWIDTSGKVENISADAVICTIPLSLLKASTIQFVPPLPDDLIDAINQLNMGTAEKLYIRMNSAFWLNEEYPRDSDVYAFLPEEGQPLIELTSLAKFPVNTEPLLLLYSAANVAKHIASLWKTGGKTAVKEWIMQYIIKLPGYTPTEECQIDDLFSTDWLNDPFARGSYSYSPTGSIDTRKGCDRIARGWPEQHIFFAGEHAASEEAGYEIGTSHGAYGSGQHTANLVLSHLN